MHPFLFIAGGVAHSEALVREGVVDGDSQRGDVLNAGVHALLLEGAEQFLHEGGHAVLEAPVDDELRNFLLLDLGELEVLQLAPVRLRSLLGLLG